MPFTEFVYDGVLPALDGPAASWFFPAGQQPDLDRIAKLAASLGVEGEVRALSPDQGGGWAVGPEDYSAAVLSVGTDGMLTWYLSSAPTASTGVGCIVSAGVADVATSSTGSGSSGSGTGVATGVAVDAAPVTDPAPAETLPADGTVDPGLIPNECSMPEPPVGVPTQDEAVAKAKQMFADWGYDVDSYQFDDAYADEWGAYVNASLVLDGMKAPVMLSAGFGENGSLTYASGYLASPERGADYPTVGATAGLDRLKAQQNQYVGLDQTAVMESSDPATTGADAAITDVAVAPDVAVPPCEPESARADCSPVNVEPFKVTLNSVKTDLTMVWAADNTIWLLPAYTFGSADGGTYSVIAIEDAYIHEADPVADTPTIKPAIDPGAVPVPAVGGVGGYAPNGSAVTETVPTP
ncbi:MAG: hypothetical protein ABI894_07830 [Ilumatobacteraceae bacterium]